MIFGFLWRRSSFSSCNAQQVGLAACTFALLYLIALLCVSRSTSWDPGSWFFDPGTAYRPQYTTVRSVQAERFIVAAEAAPPFQWSKTQPEPPELCVENLSIAREGVDCLCTTVDSLLEGLSQQERDGIHLIVFLAQSDPVVHPATHQLWLKNLADEILGYGVSNEQLAHAVEMENDQALVREKGLFDYIYLLKACLRTNTSHIAMFEDDVKESCYACTAVSKATTLKVQQPLLAPAYLSRILRLLLPHSLLGNLSFDMQKE